MKSPYYEMILIVIFTLFGYSLSSITGLVLALINYPIFYYLGWKYAERRNKKFNRKFSKNGSKTNR